MNINKLTLDEGTLPMVLARIPGPPKALFHRGAPLEELLSRPCIAIVGSRNLSPYGERATADLARKLAEQGLVIISGLALGVDALAQDTAIKAGGKVIAVLPGPVDHIYPASNRWLADRVLEQGGALVSEYDSMEFTRAFKANFVARNRLVAGLAQAVLITEAAEKSGSLHTARFALEQGKDVLAVPGSIYSPTSVGTNNLIKSGAKPVTSYIDVMHALELVPHTSKAATVIGRNAYEQRVIDLLIAGVNDGEKLLNQSELSVTEFNQVLTMLEIGGKIRALGANQWSLM